MQRDFKLTRAELMPVGIVKDWKIYKEQQEIMERAKREHLAAQRLGLIPAEPHAPNPTPREPTPTITPRERDYVRTFEQWNRSAPQGQRPFSWMTTSPYNMTGVETRDK
jgi:hypothetical protein